MVMILEEIAKSEKAKELPNLISCRTCKNKKCNIVISKIDIDVKEHHENYDWDMVFDCKNHNKWRAK